MLDNRNKMPEAKDSIKFKLPGIQQFNFKDKLPVYFIEKNKLPIVQIGLIINAGSKYDVNSKYGTAKLTAMLIDEGAGKYNALELDNEFESLGTILDISIDKDSTIISMLSLTENFKKSFELLSMILKKPHFGEQDFIREKEKLKTKLLQLKDEPDYLAHAAFDKIIFQNTPYSNPVYGTIDDIENITVDDLKAFYKNFYGSNNAELIVVGNIVQPDIMNILENFFPDWNEVKIPEIVIPKLVEAQKKIFVIHRDNAPQTEMMIGHVSGNRKSSDFYAKSLMNAILGGQFTSRINLNLREDKGFTYGAHSAFTYNKKFGQFFVSTSVKAGNTGEALTEILNEIDKIQENVTENEIDFAKSFLIERFPSQFETYSQLVRNLVLLYVHSLPLDYFNHYVDKMNSVTAGDVLTAAKNNLNKEKLTIVLVGDKNKIAKQFDSSFIELDFEGNTVND